MSTPEPSSAFVDLFSRHALSSFAKQWQLADVVGERDWSIALDEGLLRFGDDLAFRAQLLGSEADGPQTWLWAWANEASQLPPGIVQLAHRIREQGRGVPELEEPELPLEVANGHQLAMLAVGMAGAGAYYSGPHGGGAVLLVIDDPSYPAAPPMTAVRFGSVFPALLQEFAFDHRVALSGFVEDFGIPARAADDDGVEVDFPDGTLTVSFDELGRVAGIAGRVGG